MKMTFEHLKIKFYCLEIVKMQIVVIDKLNRNGLSFNKS